jgi:hypothetical protein
VNDFTFDPIKYKSIAVCTWWSENTINNIFSCYLSGDRARRSPRKSTTAMKEEKKRWVMPKFLPLKYDVKLITEDKVCFLCFALILVSFVKLVLGTLCVRKPLLHNYVLFVLLSLIMFLPGHFMTRQSIVRLLDKSSCPIRCSYKKTYFTYLLMFFNIVINIFLFSSLWHIHIE